MVAWYVVVLPVLFVAFLLLLVFVLYFSTPSKRNLDLEKTHAVVTGGSKGIGKEIARSLLKRGANVSIMARNEEDLKKAQTALQKYADKLNRGLKVQYYSVDLTAGYEKIEEAIRRAEADQGPVDVLINNAGNAVQGAFQSLPVEDFDKMIKINYLSAVYASRVVIKGMQERRKGHISFVSSAAGQCGIYGYTAYSPSKFAIRGFADVLHMELLPYKIGVSVLYPPNTDTEGFKEELLSMPEELSIISDAAGLATPKQVAEAHVKDIQNGEYATTIGVEGWMLGTLTAGASPEKNVLRGIVQCLLGGTLRYVMLLYIGYFNRVCKQCHLRRQANKKK